MSKWVILVSVVCGVASFLLSALLARYFHKGIEYPLLVPRIDQITVFDDGDIMPLPGTALTFKKADVERSVTSTNEALVSLHAALEMQARGKHEKALKLYKHAMAIHPRHPDILNHYGEFLEKNKSDIIQADLMYTKAVSCRPEHVRALENRKRTQLIVEKLDRSLLERLDYKRDKLMKISIFDPSLMRVKKEAYFQYIYHTVGIEGNTMTLSQTRSILETNMAVADKSLTEHNEILGMDAALKYINSTLVHRIGAITVQDLLEIHRRVMGYVDPVQGGTLRRTQVYVAEHVPPAPRQLDLLMEELVQWLNSEGALKLHPVKFAALAHYKLVYIHPFLDGNGRTSRLLMNMILMQVGFPPVIIRKSDRFQYYETLEQANEGDLRPFIRFIAECTERTLDYYLWATTQYPPKEIPALARDDGRTIVMNDEDEESVAPSEL